MRSSKILGTIELMIPFPENLWSYVSVWKSLIMIEKQNVISEMDS